MCKNYAWEGSLRYIRCAQEDLGRSRIDRTPFFWDLITHTCMNIRCRVVILELPNLLPLICSGVTLPQISLSFMRVIKDNDEAALFSDDIKARKQRGRKFETTSDCTFSMT